MLDINGWFFVQLANFILLFIVLNKILYKPMLQLFQQREDNTKGALASARALDEEKDALLNKVEEKLSGARASARGVFEKLSSEGMEVQRSSIESAQNEAVEINRSAKAEIVAATEKARTSLKSDIESFAKQIVEKLVGV